MSGQIYLAIAAKEMENVTGWLCGGDDDIIFYGNKEIPGSDGLMSYIKLLWVSLAKHFVCSCMCDWVSKKGEKGSCSEEEMEPT